MGAEKIAVCLAWAGLHWALQSTVRSCQLPSNKANPLTTGRQSGWLPVPGWAHLPVPPLPSWLTAHRTLKRKSSNTKRLSPTPQLDPSSDSHTSYYEESLVRESYFGSPRAVSLARSSILNDQLHSDPYWSKCPEPFSWGFASSGNLRSQMPPFPFPPSPQIF